MRRGETRVMKVGEGGNKAGSSRQTPLGYPCPSEIFLFFFFFFAAASKFNSPPVQKSGLMRGRGSFSHLRGAQVEGSTAAANWYPCR